MAVLSPSTFVTVFASCLLFLGKPRITLGQSLSAEAAAQKIEVKIYDTTVRSWNSSVFEDLVRDSTSYCNSQPSSCGLLSSATFSISDIYTSSPIKEGSSIAFDLYITFPSGASVDPTGSTQYVLPSSATNEIVSIMRDSFHDASGLWVTYIGDDYYSIPPDVEANQVVIPLAFLVVCCTGITAIAMHNYEKKKEKRDKLKMRIKEKKNLASLPNYNILETTTTTVLSNNETPRIVDRRIHYDKVSPEVNNINYSSWNVEKSPPNSKSVTSAAYAPPSVNEFHEPLPPKKNGLSPLDKQMPVVIQQGEDAEETEADKKERKRRRKERRREKRRLQELEMYENRGFDSSNVSDNENNSSSLSKRPIHTISVEQDAN